MGMNHGEDSFIMGANLQFDSCPVKVGVCVRGNCPDSYQVLIWCFPFGKISIFMIMYMV